MPSTSHSAVERAKDLDILFVEELAVLLGRTPDAIRKALREGRLGPYGQLCGRLFVFKDRLMEFLRTREVDPMRRPTRGARRQSGGVVTAG